MVVVFILCRDDFFFFREMYGDKVNNTSLHVLYFDDEAFFTCRQSLARTIQHIFFQLAPKLLWNCFSWRNYGYKINVMIWQRISRSGKRRQKWDFLPWLYCNAVFFSVRGSLKNEASLHNPISLASLFMVTSHGKRKPTGDKVLDVCVTIFLGIFFYYCKQSKHFFFSWITANSYQQHMQMNEVCAVWVMTEDSLERYPACVLVPFLADQKGGILDFILH